MMIISASYQAGSLIIRKKNNIPKFIDCFLKVVIGEQALIYFIMLMGVFKLIIPILFASIIILLNVIIFFKNYSKIQSFFKNINSYINNFNPKYFFPLFFLLLINILLTMNTFTPFSWYDSLVYHIAVPDTYIMNKSICYIPGNVYSNFPLNGEFINLMALLNNGEICAKFMITLHIFMIQILCFLFVFRKTKNLPMALIPPLLIGTNLTIAKQIIQGNIDIFLTFSCSVFFMHLFYSDFKDKNDFIISGILSGITAGYKYIAAPLFILPGLLLIIYKTYHNKNKSYLIYFFLFSIISYSPWIIKNLILTNNPLYPFLFTFFCNSKEWNSFLNTIFKAIHNTERSSLLSYCKTLLITLDGSLYLLILCSFNDKKIRLMAFVLSVSILLWMFLTPGHNRYILPTYPIFTSLAIISIFKLDNFKKYSLFYLLIYSLITVRLLSFTILSFDSLPYMLGIKDTSEKLQHLSDPYYKAIDFINKKLPLDNTNILFLNEARTYNSKHKKTSSTIFNQSIIEDIIKRSETTEDILKILKKKGYSHIFYNHAEFIRLNKSYKRFFPALAGYSFKQDSKYYKLFIKFIEKISKENIFKENKNIIIYELQ